MAVTSRADLIAYCYRALGAPLVEINMTDEQADDLVDDAIEFFRDYYWDGIERVYMKHKITQADIDNRYVTLPDSVFGVNRVFPNGSQSSNSTYIFDVEYQLRANDLRDLTSTSIIYYQQAKMHLDLLDFVLNTQKQFRWNKLTNKLYIDENWDAKEIVDNYLLIDCYTALDPAEAPKFWDNRLFKLYCTALFKKQWGTNIKKYSGITLPGGITLNGQDIYDEGKTEMEDVEKDIMENMAPLEWQMG